MTLLGRVLPRIFEAGGSHAQRDFFNQIHLDSLIKSGNTSAAQQVLESRRSFDPNGVPLNKLLEKVNPTSKAKYIKFESVLDPEQMRGQRYPILDWPYKEGLRIDEAMHPLTIMVTGLYGKELPNQNGSPIRLMVPWKYGFKSAKAIVRISFVEKMPTSSWMKASPREYGFYSNVNPNVDHPRWSQATERVIGEGILAPRIPTLMFNGYEEEVAHLYKDMDLRKYY